MKAADIHGKTTAEFAGPATPLSGRGRLCLSDLYSELSPDEPVSPAPSLLRLRGGQSRNVHADFSEKVKVVQLGGAGKGMAEGDFGLIPGTTAVGWELTLAPSAGCGGTPTAARPGGGICGSGGAPRHAAWLARGLAAAVSCQGRRPLQGMIQSCSAGQQLSHGEAQIAPQQAGTGGWEQGWGARRDPGWHSNASGKTHWTASYAGAQHDAREVPWEAAWGQFSLRWLRVYTNPPKTHRALGRAGPRRVAGNHPQAFLPGMSRAVGCG